MDGRGIMPSPSEGIGLLPEGARANGPSTGPRMYRGGAAP